MKKKIAVIGLGRFARQIARQLYKDGAEVIAVDKDRRRVDNISDSVTVAVRMDCTDEQALRSQGIDKVDTAIVGLREDFEAMVMTTVLLKSMEIGQIICRAERDIHADILRRIGADVIIQPEDEAAMRWSARLTAPHIRDRMEFAPGFSLIEYEAPKMFDGKSLIELDLRRQFNVNLIALTRKDKSKVINVPTPGTKIYEGDILWVVGSEEDLRNLPMQK